MIGLSPSVEVVSPMIDRLKKVIIFFRKIKAKNIRHTFLLSKINHARPYTDKLRRKTINVYGNCLQPSYTTLYVVLRPS
jgi:hypothetical protein